MLFFQPYPLQVTYLKLAAANYMGQVILTSQKGYTQSILTNMHAKLELHITNRLHPTIETILLKSGSYRLETL